MHHLHLPHAALVLSFALGFHETKAQPGDVSRIDIRLVEAGPNLLEVQLRPNASWDLNDGVLNLTFAIRWQSAQGGTINTDLIDQFFQGGPPFCMFIGAPLFGTSGSGLDNVDNAGSRYKGLNASGNQLPGSCSFAANTWVPYARIPVDGIAGCATFEIVGADPFTSANNSNWFISLGGTNITAQSQVVGPGVSFGSCVVDCNGIQGGPALPGTACDPGDPCIQNSVYDVNCNCVGVPVLEPVIESTSSNSPICTDAPLTLGVNATGLGPLTYSWSGAGTFIPDQESQNVTVAGAASGSYTITVSNGCGIAEALVPVVANTPPSATITFSGSPYCNTGTVPVTRTGTAGGAYSAMPVGLSLDANTGSVDLGASTPGTYTVTYTIAASGGCAAFTAAGAIVVNAVPAVSTGSYGPLCSANALITLSGSPAGGAWSGTGVTGNTFDPSAGTQTVTYSLTAAGCTGSASNTITVNSTPQPNLDPVGPLCNADGPVQLSGTPAGGTWSGTGVTGNTFDPSAGTQTVTYSLTAAGCTGAASTTITVNSTPQPNLDPVGPLCSADGPVQLSGSPAGGVWSGSGVTGNTFDPSTGTQTVTYSLTSAGCTGAASTTIVVTPSPTAEFTLGSTEFFVNEPIDFVNSSSGGSYAWDFGDGTTSDLENPSHTYTALGTYTVTLTVEEGGCNSTFSLAIVVDMSTGVQRIAGNDVRVWAAQEHIVVEHSITQGTPLLIELMDARGRVHMHMQVSGKPDRVLLPSNALTSGIWLVVLRSEQGAAVYRVPVLR